MRILLLHKFALGTLVTEPEMKTEDVLPTDLEFSYYSHSVIY